MAATDGHRLALVEVEAAQLEEGFEPVLVSKKILDELGRLDAADDAPVTIVRGANHIGFTVGPRRLFSKLDERRFPDYEKVISKDNTKKAVVRRRGAPRRRAAASPSFPATGRRPSRLAFKHGAIVVSSESQDVGDGDQEIPAEYDATPSPSGSTRATSSSFSRRPRRKEVHLFVKDEQAQCQGRPGEPLGGIEELPLRRDADADVKASWRFVSLTSDGSGTSPAAGSSFTRG